MHILAELSPLDPVSGSRVTVRASTAQDRRINALNGVRWWPAIKPDVGPLRIALFDGNFTTDIEPGSIRLTLMTDHLAKADANARRYVWAGASVTIYADATGAAWPWTTRLVGKVDSFQAEGNEVQLQIAVDQEPFQRNVLTATYAGTTGIEGDADLKNKPKPMALGRLRNIEPFLIDAANSVFQFHAYGPVQAVNALYERGSPFAASVGDYATYTALVAASIPAGRYGTCLAQGLVRLGAPPNGVITVDVDGDKPSTWLSKTGEIISRVATNAGVSAGQIDSASLTALDAAISTVTGGGGVIGVYVTEQETVLSFVRRLARPCNATAGVSLLGKLFATRVAIGAAQLTLDAQCRQQPGVYEASELPVSPPYTRIEMAANRSWRVHNYDEIAFYAELLDRGTYSGATTYREGNIVYQPTDGRTYLYTATTPTAGNAPPNVTYWALYQAGDPGIAGNANRVRFSQFEGGTVGWALNWNPNGISSGALSIGTSSGISFVRLDGTATAASQRYALGIPAAYRFAVTPGERLSVQLKLKAAGAVGSTGAFLVFVNAAGAAVGSTITVGTATGVTPYSGSEWFDARTFADVPAGAVAAYIEIHNISSGAGAMQAYLAQPMVTQAGADQVLHPSFSPGPNAADGADVTEVNAALGTNLAVNSELLNNAEGWVPGWDGDIGGTINRGLNLYDGTTYYYKQTNVLWAARVGTPVANKLFQAFKNQATEGNVESFARYCTPVMPGERYYFSWLVSAHRGTANAVIGWYDASGNYLSENSAPSITNNYGAVNGDPAQFFRSGAFVTVPANARYARIWAMMRADGSADPFIFATQPFIAKVSASQAAIPPYTPGPADRSATNGAPTGTSVGGTAAATVAAGANAANNGVNSDGTIKGDKVVTDSIAARAATDAATATAGAGTMTTGGTVDGVSVTYNVVAGKVRVDICTDAYRSAGSGHIAYVQIIRTKAGVDTLLGRNFPVLGFTGDFNPTVYWVIDTPGAGSVTYKVRYTRDSGSGTLAYNNQAIAVTEFKDQS